MSVDTVDSSCVGGGGGGEEGQIDVGGGDCHQGGGVLDGSAGMR